MGIYPGYHAIERTALLTGRLLNERDVAEARRVAVIGTRVVELLFDRARNPVGERIDVQGASYLVVGTFTDAGEEGEVRRIYIPYSAYQRSFGRGAGVEFIAFTVAEDTDPAAQPAADTCRWHPARPVPPHNARFSCHTFGRDDTI